ncbi:MAG: FkbM family methyltransferase [Phycisphaerales bacterium]|nr:FkbM family methyltransferase [Phycisphaerales bacterium]
MIDIGMNLGHFTTLGAELVGDSGTVVAFEPNPKLCKLVGEHLVTQGLGHVKIMNCALGSEEGSVTLTVPHGNTGHSFVAEVTNRHAEEQDERIEVPMRVGESELANIDTDNLIVKMDVEGAELEVLQGMKQVLREKVHAMQIEISPQWLGDSKVQRIHDLLGECGFETLSARKRGSPQPVDIRSIKEQQDVWCVRPECNPFRSSH